MHSRLMSTGEPCCWRQNPHSTTEKVLLGLLRTDCCPCTLSLSCLQTLHSSPALHLTCRWATQGA